MNPRMAVPRLQLLTDTHLQQRYTALELAQFARSAGADAVQYREKQQSTTQQVHTLQQLHALLQGSSTQLIVNDRPDWAAALPGAGAHVGLEDSPPQQARKTLGPGRLLGATVHSLAELEAIAQLPAGTVDYIGVGPVFGTTSKNTGLPPLGLSGLREICNLSSIPVVAIGSITPHTLRPVLDTGTYGVAVLAAFCLAADPAAVAAELLHLLAPYR